MTYPDKDLDDHLFRSVDFVEHPVWDVRVDEVQIDLDSSFIYESVAVHYHRQDKFRNQMRMTYGDWDRSA